MPEFTGGTPEDYYAQHNKLADEQKAARDKSADLSDQLQSEKEDYETRRARGDRDAADYRPHEPGYKAKISEAEQRADDTQKLIDAQAELGKAHLDVNQAAYHDEAAQIDKDRE